MITLGVAYLIRITVLRKVGFEATGLYQSAWTLGGLYVGFILQAMAADFYPRLTAAADDNVVCNRLVNEQARVGLLLAGPGVIASLTFAPLVVALFYSAKFGAAVGILRWICLGTILQVITWPMGFIIVAKAKRALFVGCEVAWGIVSVALAWVCISYFGLVGAGISFFGSYIFHGVLLYAVVSRTSGFRWSRESAETCMISFSLVGAAFGGFTSCRWPMESRWERPHWSSTQSTRCGPSQRSFPENRFPVPSASCFLPAVSCRVQWQPLLRAVYPGASLIFAVVVIPAFFQNVRSLA